jgi:hypothetical protein
MNSSIKGFSALGSMLTALVLSLPAAASSPASQAVFHPPTVAVDANHSTNWSGYNQGIVEQGGGTTFHAISGTWVVPTATAHTAGENEYSSIWVGIGGGCLDARCTATDATLIQAGTEQDVDASGRAHYSAWWEIIPAPSTAVSLPVNAGQRISVQISETLPTFWTIAMTNLTTGQAWSTTTPYASSYATAEWIVETPVVIDTTGTSGVAALPNLSRVTFDTGSVNSVNPGLRPSQAIQLVDANGQVVATPSSPDAEFDGFNDCSYAGSCAATPSVTLSRTTAPTGQSHGSVNRHYPSGKRGSPSAQAQSAEWTGTTGAAGAGLVTSAAGLML